MKKILPTITASIASIVLSCSPIEMAKYDPSYIMDYESHKSQRRISDCPPSTTFTADSLVLIYYRPVNVGHIPNTLEAAQKGIKQMYLVGGVGAEPLTNGDVKLMFLELGKLKNQDDPYQYMRNQGFGFLESIDNKQKSCLFNGKLLPDELVNNYFSPLMVSREWYNVETQ